MLKFKFETFIDNKQTQNIEQEVTTSFEKFVKINDATLSRIADLVKKGQESNLQTGKDIFGQSVAPKKIPNGNPIFVQSGLLLKSVSQNKVSNDEWHIFINSNREKIASYLIEGRSNMVARQFFGISDKLSKDIDNILEKDYSRI